jgi:hypothetical protein
MASHCSGVPCRLPNWTSAPVRAIASGVRSSCAASATNLRWLVKEASSLVTMSSKVFASSLSSSFGPVSATRSCSRSWEIRRVVAVSVRRGRSMRPATTQETPSPTMAVIASAIAEVPAVSTVSARNRAISAWSIWYALSLSSACWSVPGRTVTAAEAISAGVGGRTGSSATARPRPPAPRSPGSRRQVSQPSSVCCLSASIRAVVTMPRSPTMCGPVAEEGKVTSASPAPAGAFDEDQRAAQSRPQFPGLSSRPGTLGHVAALLKP